MRCLKVGLTLFRAQKAVGVRSSMLLEKYVMNACKPLKSQFFYNINSLAYVLS